MRIISPARQPRELMPTEQNDTENQIILDKTKILGNLMDILIQRIHSLGFFFHTLLLQLAYSALDQIIGGWLDLPGNMIEKIRVGCFGCDLVEQDLAGFGAVDPVGAFTANANIPVAHRFHRVEKVCKADLGAAPTAICSHTIYLLMFCRMSDNSIQYFFVFCNQRDI